MLNVKYKTLCCVIMLCNVMLSVWAPRRGASPRLSPAKDYIRQGRKCFWAENTLAYYIMLLMTTVDCFIHVAWGKMLYTFFVCNLQFFVLARAFVRIDRKSLSGTNSMFYTCFLGDVAYLFVCYKMLVLS